jgi:hypothetical protein
MPRTGEDERDSVTEHFSGSPFHGAVDPQGAATDGRSADVIEGVLTSIADLDGRPVSEHVTVFEEAHDRLRDALARAGDDNGRT